jgi:carbon monoxide dehydrogenase subunit G
MTNDLAPVDVGFLDTAPTRTTRDFRVAAQPAAVFDALARDPAGWGHWFPGFSKNGRYLSPAPHGVGSQREMHLGGLPLLETVIAWDEATRWAFRVDRATMPGVRAMAEEYRIVPDGDGSLVTWTVALDAAAPMKVVLGPLAGTMVQRAGKKLERRLQAKSATD